MAILTVHPGDIVAIPAQQNEQQGFVLSRVIQENTQVTTIEVFEGFHNNFSITADEIKALGLSIDQRLFPPVYVAFDFNKFFGKVKWPILDQDPNYDSEAHSRLSAIEFATERYDEVGEYMRNGQTYFEPDGIRRPLNNRTIYSNTQLIVRINLFLQGDYARGTALNVWSDRMFLASKGLDWYNAELNTCLALSDTVATTLKEAQAALKKTKGRR